MKQSEVSTVWLSVQLWEIYHSVLNMVSWASSWNGWPSWPLLLMNLTVVNHIMLCELSMHYNDRNPEQVKLLLESDTSLVNQESQ